MITNNGSEWVVTLGSDDLTLIAPIQDYLRLEATFNANNDIGHVTLDLPISYSGLLTTLDLLPTAADPCLFNPFLTLQLHRSVNCGPFYIEGCQNFFINDVYDILDKDKQRAIRVEADCSKWMLAQRQVNTHSEDPRADFPAPGTPADTAVHQLFDEFFGPSPPAGARDFIALGLLASTAAAGTGADWTTNAAGKDLLSVFQEASEFSESQCLPFYFDLLPTKTPTRTGERPSLPLTLETHFGRWGDDRTVGNAAGNLPVVLSAYRGNLNSFTYRNNSTEKYSVLYFYGEGMGAAQITATAMNVAALAASPWAWTETSVTDTEVTDPDVAQSRAESELTRVNKGDEFSMEILNTAGGVFGDPTKGGNWGLGDSITVDYRSASECIEEADQAVQISARNTSINVLIEDCREQVTGNFEVESCIVCTP